MTEKSLKRTLQGRVVSNKMDKTIVVLVERRIKHPIGKYVLRSKKFHAHDADNTCREGDIVIIRECRPLSKNKTWELESVLSHQES